MKKTFVALFAAVTLCGALLALSACKENVKSVTLDKTELSLYVGESAKLTPTTDPKGAETTFSTSDAAVCTVENDGTVKAVAAGSASVTAKSGDKSAVCAVTVSTRTLSITKDGAAVSALEIAIGQNVGLAAASLTEQSVAGAVWTSDNEAVATVTDGTITALSRGVAVIRVKVGDDSATLTLTVTGIKIEAADYAALSAALASTDKYYDITLPRNIVLPDGAALDGHNRHVVILNQGASVVLPNAAGIAQSASIKNIRFESEPGKVVANLILSSVAQNSFTFENNKTVGAFACVMPAIIDYGNVKIKNNYFESVYDGTQIGDVVNETAITHGADLNGTVEIEGNLFKNYGTAVTVKNVTPADYTDFKLKNNTFTGCSLSVYGKDADSFIDASYNYFETGDEPKGFVMLYPTYSDPERTLLSTASSDEFFIVYTLNDETTYRLTGNVAFTERVYDADTIKNIAVIPVDTRKTVADLSAAQLPLTAAFVSLTFKIDGKAYEYKFRKGAVSEILPESLEIGNGTDSVIYTTADFTPRQFGSGYDIKTKSFKSIVDGATDYLTLSIKLPAASSDIAPDAVNAQLQNGFGSYQFDAKLENGVYTAKIPVCIIKNTAYDYRSLYFNLKSYGLSLDIKYAYPSADDEYHDDLVFAADTITDEYKGIAVTAGDYSGGGRKITISNVTANGFDFALEGVYFRKGTAGNYTYDTPAAGSVDFGSNSYTLDALGNLKSVDISFSLYNSNLHMLYDAASGTFTTVNEVTLYTGVTGETAVLDAGTVFSAV